jgi:hypothetical protein
MIWLIIFQRVGFLMILFKSPSLLASSCMVWDSFRENHSIYETHTFEIFVVPSLIYFLLKFRPEGYCNWEIFFKLSSVSSKLTVCHMIVWFKGFK